MKFKFELKAGILMRSSIRKELNNSKLKLEYAYPGCSVTIIEEKSILESIFKVQGINFPKESESALKNWFNQIKLNVD
jgi:hypothetical protein